MEILSWNVNGYSERIHEYMKVLISSRNPDVIFLSETKRKKEILQDYFSEFVDYTCIINSHFPYSYHGVSMLLKKSLKFEELSINMGIPARKDTNKGGPETGRVIAVKLDKFILVGTYTPNAGRGLSHLPYRIIAWDGAFSELLCNYRKIMPTMLIGDINVAPEEIDVSNVEKMSKFAGFTPQERQNYRNFINDGWTDIWRLRNPDKVMYTWRGENSSPDYGMRLDTVIVSSELVDNVSEVFFIDECTESDHICVGCLVKNN